MEVWQACKFSSDVVLNADKYVINTMLSILNVYPKIFWLIYCYQSYVAVIWLDSAGCLEECTNTCQMAYIKQSGSQKVAEQFLPELWPGSRQILNYLTTMILSCLFCYAINFVLCSSDGCE